MTKKIEQTEQAAHLIGRCIAVLEQVQYADNSKCPYCGHESNKNGYHNSDCRLAALLVKLEKWPE